MLTIKQNAWHYKIAYESGLAKFADGAFDSGLAPLAPAKVNNLCTYMRQVFKPFVTGAIGIFLLFSMLTPIINFIVMGHILPTADVITFAYILFAILGVVGSLVWGVICVILAFLAIGGTCYLIDTYAVQPIKDARNARVPVEKEPNVVMLWFKAMHEKTCPLLSIEQPETEDEEH